MSQDVGPVKGPSGSPEPLSGTGKKEKPPSGEFKKIMKVEKAREVDPEEKRKRRERAEKEEEPEEGAVPTPKDKVAPFSLEEQEKKISPLEMQTPAAKPSPMQAAPRPASEAKEISAPPPSMEEMQGPPPSESLAQQSPPVQKEAPAPREEQPQRAEPLGQRPLETESQARQKEQDRLLFPEAPPPPEEEKEVFFKEFAEMQAPEEVKKEEGEKEKGELEIAPLTQPPPLSSALEKAERELKIEGESLTALPEGATPGGPTQISPEAPAAPLPPYAFMSPQVLELFERMVGTMNIMTTEGITETTIDLTSEQFASSIFFGSQIIIKEFATAPNQFNIQFNTTPEGANLFQANVDDLLAAFQSGNYAFRVLRCETHILSERPLFKRKEAAGEQGKQQRQE
jgi:hypothetical protein